MIPTPATSVLRPFPAARRGGRRARTATITAAALPAAFAVLLFLAPQVRAQTETVVWPAGITTGTPSGLLANNAPEFATATTPRSATTDAMTPFSAQRVISTDAEMAASVHAADLDGDGDADVLSASGNDDKVAWYENLGGGSFSAQRVISTDVDWAASVHAADLDGDGDADVLSASVRDDKIAWYENLGGGSFSAQRVISTDADGARSVHAADLDGDGDADVLSASASRQDGKIAWYENLGGGSFSAQRVISTDADMAESVHAADLDGDGDADVLSASASRRDGKIAWYENLGGGSFSAQRVISTDADGAGSVHAADLDGDGDADVLSASRFDDKIAWYENLGGGSFSAQRVISTDADVARSVHAADLDGDGDADVLSASYQDDKVAWYGNLGGGSFSAQRVISTDADGAISVHAADLDGDGDADVLSASFWDDKVAWYENLVDPGDAATGETLLLSEDWENGVIDPSAWTLYGSPRSRVVEFGGRSNVFDNNGDPNYDSGVVSNAALAVPDGRAVDIEADVYLDFSDRSGCWAGVLIGLALDADVEAVDLSFRGPGTGLSFSFHAEGDACWATPVEHRRKAWFSGGFRGSGSERIRIPSFTVSGEDYVGGWHRLTIRIDASNRVSLRMDGTLLWESMVPLDPAYRSARLLVGGRSSGSAGKAYLDDVEVTAAAATAGAVSRSFRFVGERPDDRVGWSLGPLDLGDGALLVGAPFHDPDGREDGGAAYLIAVADLTAADLADGRADGRILLSEVASQPASWKLIGAAAGDRAGWSVSAYEPGAGASGVVVTAPGRSSSDAGGGAAYLLDAGALEAADAADGTTDGIIDLANVAAQAASWLIVGQSGTVAGTAAVPAGDVDGDGQGELLLHARRDDDLGGAMAYLLSVADLPAADSADGREDGVAVGDRLAAQAGSWRFVGTDLGGRGGAALASAGDANGDARADLAFGAPRQSPGGRIGAGTAWLASSNDLAAADRGSGNDADGTIDVRDLAARPESWRFVGERPFDQAGAAVASAGDVDGDGLDDLIVGAPHHSHGGDISRGAAYLVATASLQQADNADQVADGSIDLANIAAQPGSWKFVGESPDDAAGVGLSSAGDVDGDGLSDLLIGADDRATYLIATSDLPDADAADGAEDGVVELGNVAAQPNSWAIRGQGQLGGPGVGLASAGDVDGDGVPDLMIGAAHNDDTGAVYLLASTDLARADAADGTVDGTLRLDSIGDPADEDGLPAVGAAGVLVGAVRGNTVGHNALAEFDVRLLSRPANDVAIPVSSSDESQGVTEQAEIVLGPDDWNIPRTVAVRGRNADYDGGVRDYEVELGPTRSLDDSYDGLSIPAVPMRGIVLEVGPPVPLIPLVADNEGLLTPEVVYTGRKRLSFSLTESPAGMAIDLSSGQITWTPAETDEGGTFDVAVAVNDGGRFAETSFAVRVVQPMPIAVSVSDDTLTVTDTGTDLVGMTITHLPGDGSEPVTVPLDATEDLGELGIALMPADALHPIPPVIGRLSDAFVVKRPHGAGVRIAFTVAGLSAGQTVRDVRLYTLTGADDVEGLFWSTVFADIGYDGTADAPVLQVELLGLQGVFFFGTRIRANRNDPDIPPPPGIAPGTSSQSAGSSASSADVDCTPGRRWPWDDPGDEYLSQTCTHEDIPALSVTVVDFGTSATSTRWQSARVEDLVAWLVEARTEFDALGMDYEDEFNVEIFEEQANAQGIITLGYVTTRWFEGRRTLHLNAFQSLDSARTTTAHEYFHHAQSRSDREGFDLLIDRRAGKWMTEGSARWFEDRIYDQLLGVHTRDTRILEEGLAAAEPRDVFAPYRRFAFVKLLEKRCPDFDGTYRNMINVVDDDPNGVARLVAELGNAGCNFGDHFGADRNSKLEAALAYYNYATMFERDINLLDVDGNEIPFPFERSSYAFDRARTWMADVNNWSNLPADQTPKLNGIDHIPPAGAYSFHVDAAGDAAAFAGKVADLSIDASGELLVSLTSGSTGFQGVNTIGTRAHDWFSTAARTSYVYDAHGSVPNLFVTLVNPSLTDTVNVSVHFRVRDGIDVDADITSHDGGDEVDTRVVTVAGSIPAEVRDSVSKVVVTGNGIPTDTSMNADGTFAADVVVSLGANTIKAQALGAAGAVTNEAVVTITGVESNSTGRNALLASRIVAVLRWDTATDLDIYSTDKEDRTIWYAQTAQGPGSLDFDDVSGYGPEVVSYRATDDDVYVDGTFDVDVHYFSGTPSTDYTLDVVLNERDGQNKRLLRFDSIVPHTVSASSEDGPDGSGNSRFNDLLRISCSSARVCSLANFDAGRLAQARTVAPTSNAESGVPPAAAAVRDEPAVASAYERCLLEGEKQMAKSGRLDWYCNSDGTKSWR